MSTSRYQDIQNPLEIGGRQMVAAVCFRFHSASIRITFQRDAQFGRFLGEPVARARIRLKGNLPLGL